MLFHLFHEWKDEKWKAGKKIWKLDHSTSRGTRLPSFTCVSIMAALLRFGAARACRILSAYGVRNTAIYQRNSPSFYKENILKACHPSVSGCRYLSNDISASADPGETFENSTEGESAAEDRNRSLGWKDRPSLKRGGDFQYERQVRQLGTLVMKPVLLRVFKEILHRGRQANIHCKLKWAYCYVSCMDTGVYG